MLEDKINYLNLFDHLGTENCTLDCREWQHWVTIKGSSSSNNTQKRAKRQRKEQFKTANRANTRPRYRQTSSTSNSLRASFTLDELVWSVSNGCRCCTFFKSIIDRLLPMYQNLGIKDFILKWINYGFKLQLSERNSSWIQELQLFCSAGKHYIYKARIELIPAPRD